MTLSIKALVLNCRWILTKSDCFGIDLPENATKETIGFGNLLVGGTE